jgi:hypothetical protein
MAAEGAGRAGEGEDDDSWDDDAQEGDEESENEGKLLAEDIAKSTHRLSPSLAVAAKFDPA